ncbi:MAG: HAD family hydrolase [Candidatus Thorarchaeota archaeon]|jgi:putative hydrolase of the HAD superfamily
MARALVLDMDGVIRHVDLEASEDASQAIGFSYNELMEILWYSEIGNQLLIGKVSRDKWWKGVVKLDKRLEGLSQDVIWYGVFREEYLDWELINFVTSIKEDFVTAILTNCDIESKIQILEEIGPNHPFDHIVSSSDLGAIKPDEDAFFGLFQVIGVRADECIFFDDSPRNIDAALKIGMEAFLYRGLEHLKSTIKKS